MLSMKQYANDGTNIRQKIEKNYITAKKDKEFNDFVNTLNIEDNILMKYTSMLKESCKEYSNCKNCKNIVECKNKIKGSIYLPKKNGNKLIFSYSTCKFANEQAKELAYLKNITLFEAPKYIENISKENISAKYAERFECIKWITKFIKDYPNVEKGLYLHGSFGCGKSYMLTAALVDLAHKGYKSTIVFWPEFLRKIKSTFGNDGMLDGYIYALQSTPILLIDDIGAENNTAWTRDEILFPILEHRSKNNLITLFTSNLNKEELTRQLAYTKDGNEIVKAKRIIERINLLTDDMELISKNLRN